MIMMRPLELSLLDVLISIAPEDVVGDLVLHVVLVGEQPAPEAELVVQGSPGKCKGLTSPARHLLPVQFDGLVPHTVVGGGGEVNDLPEMGCLLSPPVQDPLQGPDLTPAIHVRQVQPSQLHHH